MEILGLFFFTCLLVSWLLPWINWARIRSTRKELDRLKRELWELQKLQDTTAQVSRVGKEVNEPVKVGLRQVGPKLMLQEHELAVTASEEAVAEVCNSELASVRSEEQEVPGSRHSSAIAVEPQDLFSKIAIWVGGVALLMAGFYMIKYSIESGWLTPVVRLCMTAVFGALLCSSGFVIGIKSSLVANERIGNVLAGAGVACLYFAAYAAVHLYRILTPSQGFGAMLAVTILAVVISLKNGAPIAMLSLIGGFLTPWLMSPEIGDTVLLFIYLFLLLCGAQLLCLLRGWWWLLLGSIVGAYLWSIVVILSHFGGFYDSQEGCLLFLVGICFVNALWAFFVKCDTLEGSAKRVLSVIRILTWCGGVVQAFILVLIGGFAAVDVALFSVLSVGALVLAVLKEDDFIWAAWLALSAVAVATLSHVDSTFSSWLFVPSGLHFLFFLVGHWRGLRRERAFVWRSLSLTALLLLVPLLYLNHEYIAVSDWLLHPAQWLWLSGLCASLLALAGEHLYYRQVGARVAGEYSAFAIFLLSFGIWTYVPGDYLAHSAAGLWIVAALYWKQRQFGRSVLVVGVFSAAWATLMLVHAADVCAYFFREELFDVPPFDELTMSTWALGLLAAITMFVCFARVWSRSLYCAMSWGLGMVACFSLVACYQYLDVRYMSDAWSTASIEGGLTGIFALLSIVFIYLSRKWSAYRWASFVAAGLVGLRVVILHLGDSGAAGPGFFWNALQLQFGLPFLAACVLAWECDEHDCKQERRVCQLAAMCLGFIFATFLVQDYFGGSRILDQNNSSSEIYTYSVVWLLLAMVYQAIGLWRQQSAIHVGSLVLLLITVGKVFLVDASELEGFFRVLSFLGLGLALIVIGFFYNKVVFARREQA
jgi:uncharacterized membrane protein